MLCATTLIGIMVEHVRTPSSRIDLQSFFAIAIDLLKSRQEPIAGRVGDVIVVCLLLAQTAVILVVTRRKRKGHPSIQFQPPIDGRISEWSARLATCPSGQVDNEISNVLQALVAAEQLDRASWFVISEKESLPRETYSDIGSGVSHESAVYSRSDLPHITTALMRGEPICLETLDDLPTEGECDRMHLQERGVKSVAFIPTDLDSLSRGVLLLITSRPRKWDTGLIERLSLLGDVFANAIARKRTQRALQQSELRFQSLLDSAPVGIALERLDGHIVFANPALCSMLGYAKDDMLAMNCSQFADPDDEQEDWAQFQRLQRGEITSYALEKRYVRKGGDYMWGWLNVAMLKSDDDPLVFATVEDITNAKRANDAVRQTHEELQRLTSRLLDRQEDERRRISRELHDDIGQRLSLLKIELDTLENTLDGVGYDQSVRISALAAQVEELVMDIHNMSHQLHSSKLKYLGLEVALKELCRQVSSKYQLEIELAAEPLGSPLSEQISLCLYRVAQEAVSNAVRYSSSSRIEVKLTHKGSAVCMMVKDFGMGFDPVDRGKGLGLVTMQERLRSVNGYLTVVSSAGQGTEVIAEVPIATSNIA